MNKLHVLALTGLIVCGVNNASMGQEQREVLYALHTLGQNFADVPMVVQNIDMFAGVLEMNIQINEAKLQVADQKIKDTILTNAAIFVGAVVGRTAITDAMNRYMKFNFKNLSLGNLLSQSANALAWAGQMLIILNIHDAWKNRSALMEALALDKELLGKLEEIKGSVDFIEENTGSAENFLLNSAE